MEAAVNNAMLDLAARSANVPVYQYLGGPTRFKARVVARVEGATKIRWRNPCSAEWSRAFEAFSFPIPARDAMWRMQAYTDAIRRRLARLKAAAGAEADFVLDAGATLTPGDASFVATAFERDHLLWLDEPTDVLTNDALSRISDESVTPVGLGRGVHDVATFQNLLRWGCVDILRPSIGLNSIRQIRRMAAVAETHYVAVGPYHDGGPIGDGRGHSPGGQPAEFFRSADAAASGRAGSRHARGADIREIAKAAKDGFAPLVNQPGLGIEVNEQALKKYSEEIL